MIILSMKKIFAITPKNLFLFFTFLSLFAIVIFLGMYLNHRSPLIVAINKANSVFHPNSTEDGFKSQSWSSSPLITNIDTTVATGPLFVNSDNPRYFTDGTIINGKYKAIVLTGSHTWCDFIDCSTSNPPAVFNYTAFLEFLINHNHNFFRLWRAENARGGENGDDFWFDPMPFQRSNECCAFDGGNKFNLNQFNQAYFDRMRQRIIKAGERGIYVSIMLFDGWSVSSKFSTHQPWKGHPYNISNNVNGVDGDTNNDNQGDEIQTLSNQQITHLQEAYVQKVIDTVNDLDNVLYEISNESTGSSDNTVWQYHMINFIKDYEATKPKQHPVGMTVAYPNGNNSDLYNSPADWISPIGDLNNPPVSNGSKVILADTDHLCGICGDRYWVWKSFTRGENPIFMDPYDKVQVGRGAPADYDPNNPNDVSLRKNLGYVRIYAQRMNLVKMTPRPDLCSTGYCLANPVATDADYLVYAPNGGQITINLTSTPGEITLVWFNPQNGIQYASRTQNGGKIISVKPPFDGDAVLYLTNQPPIEYPYKTSLPAILKRFDHKDFFKSKNLYIK